MRGSRQELPVAAEMPEGTIRQVNWGAMTVEVAEVRQTIDVSPFFKGLPDDRCQCSHWGYVLKGRMRYRYADHEEVYGAGDVYYAAPGHTPVLEAGCEYVEFSPSDELSKTMEVVERNMIGMQ
jgi:hypothetical protein